ncbi:hypothetical protein [Rathayibacter festucae]|nr:hypothetical protein [Rathayibacter festucae]
MSEMDNLIGGLRHEAYRIELLGEAVAVEGRELRHAADTLERRVQEQRSNGFEPDNQAAIEAAFDKMSDGPQREIRYQLDSMRDVIRTIR